MENRYIVYGGIALLVLICLAGVFVYFGNPSGFATVAKTSVVAKTTPSTFTASCSDSDGGKVADKAGTASGVLKTGAKFSYKDYCKTATSVYEYYCTGTAPGSTVIACQNGFHCTGGACVKDAAAVTCTDSDGGQVADKVGTVTYTDANGVVTTYTDSCTTNETGSYIDEFYCSANKQVINGSFKCTGGTTSLCRGGLCVVCYDTGDADQNHPTGLNTGVAGTCMSSNTNLDTGNYIPNNDTCWTNGGTVGNKINEFYCGNITTNVTGCTSDVLTCPANTVCASNATHGWCQ